MGHPTAGNSIWKWTKFDIQKYELKSMSKKLKTFKKSDQIQNPRKPKINKTYELIYTRAETKKHHLKKLDSFTVLV